MRPLVPCAICHTKPASQGHHMFPQTKVNRRLYRALLDDSRNMMPVCADCHPSAPHLSEREFCERLGIATRSKTGKL